VGGGCVWVGRIFIFGVFGVGEGGGGVFLLRDGGGGGGGVC